MADMKRTLLAFGLLAAVLTLATAQSGKNPFAGRWDITVTTPKDTYPDWMELVEKNGQPEVRIQPRAGSVQPATNVKLDGSHLTLAMGSGSAPTWDLTVEGNQLKGTQKNKSGSFQLAGVRAPELKRPMPKAWTDPEPLFDGKDLTGWEPFSPSGAQSHWVAQNGDLLNESKGANIRTTRKFEDFKLHIEYNCPLDGNSGVYLRGRYEVQVEYEKPGMNDRYHSMGSIYGFLAPSVELPRKPGQWEGYDITLVGRYVTVVRDGVKVIDNQEIPGITGGALDSHEGEPGPFYIQGDHTGGMRYRNIKVSVPKS